MNNPHENGPERIARKRLEVTDTLHLEFQPSGMVTIDPQKSGPLELTPTEAATLQKLLAIDCPLPGYRGEQFFILNQDFLSQSANPEDIVSAVGVDGDSLHLTALASANETNIGQAALPQLRDTLQSRSYCLGESPSNTDICLPERLTLPLMVQSVDEGTIAMPLLTAERDEVLEYIYERRGPWSHTEEQFVASE